jgi:hypothetical protein
MAGVKITQLTPTALPGRRYGSFAGKALSLSGPHNPGKITQQAPYMALMMQRYGSFAGKSATTPVGSDVSPHMRRSRARRHRSARFRFRRGPN